MSKDNEKPEEQKKRFSNLSENQSSEGDNSDTTSDINEKQKNFDPDKLSDEIESETYTPITENPVNKKEYSQPYQENKEIIPEPTFEIPTFDSVNEEVKNNATNNSATAKVSPLANPEMQQASSQEQVQGAEILADAILDGYGKLHELGQWYVSVDEETLIEKAMDDKIDLSMEIPANDDGTETVTLKEFVTNFNEQSKQALQLDPTFVEKVREPMIRVFVKRGWGLTDEQYLGYMFGRDIIEKTTIMVGLKRSMNRTMSMLEKTYAKMKQVQNNINEGNDGQAQPGNQSQNNHNIHDAYKGSNAGSGKANEKEEDVHYTTVEEPEETKYKGESDLKDIVTIVPATEETPE